MRALMKQRSSPASCSGHAVASKTSAAGELAADTAGAPDGACFATEVIMCWRAAQLQLSVSELRVNRVEHRAMSNGQH